MWIKNLEIKNFQCHEHLALEFGSGLNAITGESDRGKSAIIRALRWLIFNKPEGQQMRKHGSKETIVSAELDNGTIITRSRSAVTNRYSIKKRGEREVTFDNFGVRVPEPIVESFGIGTAKLAENLEFELSIGQQFDPPFLLYESASVRAQVLGTLSKTNLIDSTIRAINNEIRLRGRHVNMIEEGVKQCEAEMAGFANLAEQEKTLVKIERDLKALALVKDGIDRCAIMKTALEQLNLAIKVHGEKVAILESLPDTDHLELLGRQLERSAMIHDRLTALNQDIQKIQGVIEKIDTVTPAMVESLEERARSLDAASAFQRRVQDWKTRFMGNATEYDSTNRECEQVTAKLIETITAEGRCPTCFREIDSGALEIIKKGLA